MYRRVVHIKQTTLLSVARINSKNRHPEGRKVLEIKLSCGHITTRVPRKRYDKKPPTVINCEICI